MDLEGGNSSSDEEDEDEVNIQPSDRPPSPAKDDADRKYVLFTSHSRRFAIFIDKKFSIKIFGKNVIYRPSRRC